LKVRFSQAARSDLRAAVEFLTAKNPSAAIDLKEQLLTTVERLARGEFEGPEVQLRSGAIVRSWPVTPYRIYYQRSAEEFQVIRMYHQARKPIVSRLAEP
jgi:plasmid stabilization system protein ParE